MESVLDDNYIPVEIDLLRINVALMKIATEFSILKTFDFMLESYGKTEKDFLGTSKLKELSYEPKGIDEV